MESAAARLEHLAERHVPGSGAVRIDTLGSGLTNSSYRVRRDERSFSLRVAAPRASELGLDRGWECRVLRCAAAAGLSPAVERCEPDEGILVMRWAEGRSWSAEETSSEANIGKVAELVRRVHGLPLLDRPRIVTPGQWIAHYSRTLQRRRSGSAREGSRRRSGSLETVAQSHLDALSEEPSAGPALCHGDLHAQNLLIAPDGATVVLDWEYAHISDPWWDLAAWGCNGDLPAERAELLLRLYLGSESTAAQAERLRRLAWLYDYVCLLWSEVYLSSRPEGGEAAAGAAAGAASAATGAAREAVSARAQRLWDRLRQRR